MNFAQRFLSIPVLLLCTLASAAAHALAPTEIFISEYVEGSSNNKAIEIYNPTGSAVDLGAGDYKILVYFNGSGSAGLTVGLAGTLAAGDVFIFAHASADAAILAVADLTTGAGLFNGDDAVVLTKNGTVIDAIGQVGFDPGSEWGTGNTSTQDNTLRRKSGVCVGDSDASNVFDPSVEWDGFPQNTFDGLGTHTGCGGGGPSLIINEVDADQAGTDAAEFVELFDGGVGNTSLDGLLLVFYNGSDDLPYNQFDLDGFSTNDDGYFVVCGDPANVANCDLDGSPDTNFIQNGADAVALYVTDDFEGPAGAVFDITAGLIDALVYDTNDDDDAGLLVLLNEGQPQVNENGSGSSTTHSNQRCPNGSGGARNTSTYEQWSPTPGAENICEIPLPVFACGNDVTLIHDIQGNTDNSPMQGTVVDIEAVVTADYQAAGELGGFFVQEEDADADGDAMTSEGIFVFNSSVDVAVGDHVRVRGTAIEFFGFTELSPATDVEICASGVAQPTPVAFSLPATPDAYEPVEGMRISMAQTLHITDVFATAQFGEIQVSSERLYNPTNVVAPGGPANALSAANANDRLIVDDLRNGSWNTPFVNGADDATEMAADNPIRFGNTLPGVEGVMDYSFSRFRLRPVVPIVINESDNPRTASPAAVGGTIKVASFNVLNYFSTVDDSGSICGPAANQGCRGADTEEERVRQLDKIVAALTAIDADVIGLMEIENNSGQSTADIVDGLNAANGAGTYEYVDTGTIGDDVIKVAMIYKPASVVPQGAFAILDSSVDARFDDSLSRPALAQTFRDTSSFGGVTVVVNHLKSKSCSGAGGLDADQNDGQACYNAARTSAAEALADWSDSDPTGTGYTAALIIGDLNSYAMEDPISTLTGEGYTNLVNSYVGATAYSFTFFGELGYLDHALSSADLTPQVTGTTIWNSNADEIRQFDYNTENLGANPKPASFYAPDAYRASDHDAVVAGLELLAPNPGSTRATFLVSKDFTDTNPGEVTVTIDCNTGLILDQDKEISEGGGPVEFVVTSYTAGSLNCTISETSADGYSASYVAELGENGVALGVGVTEEGCEFTQVADGQMVCTITNTLDPVTVTVNKEWIIEGSGSEGIVDAYVTLYCSLHKGAIGSAWINPSNPGVFQVYPHHSGETCYVTEEPIEAAESDVSGCSSIAIAPGKNGSCTVVNTRFYEGIPTLGPIGLGLMTLLMLGVGMVGFRRFS